MAEPRARVRQKGQVFSSDDLSALLSAFSQSSLPPKPTPSNPNPPPVTPQLASTTLTLDALLTDFIIETCHYAALSASYSRRQKIKADDFKFVLRQNEVLMGKVMENAWRDRDLKEKRKALGEGLEGEGMGVVAGLKGKGKGMEGLDGGEGAGEDGEGEGGGRRKKRRKGKKNKGEGKEG